MENKKPKRQIKQKQEVKEPNAKDANKRIWKTTEDTQFK